MVPRDTVIRPTFRIKPHRLYCIGVRVGWPYIANELLAGEVGVAELHSCSGANYPTRWVSLFKRLVFSVVSSYNMCLKT